MVAPAFSNFGNIYPGPHQGSDGKLDERVWFNIAIDLDVYEGTVTYLIFPYGASNDEIRELKVSATGSWIA